MVVLFSADSLSPQDVPIIRATEIAASMKKSFELRENTLPPKISMVEAPSPPEAII
jgi:hypothetical protein